MVEQWACVICNVVCVPHVVNVLKNHDLADKKNEGCHGVGSSIYHSDLLLDLLDHLLDLGPR
jgi:hypothetical protein